MGRKWTKSLQNWAKNNKTTQKTENGKKWAENRQVTKSGQISVETKSTKCRQKKNKRRMNVDVCPLFLRTARGRPEVWGGGGISKYGCGVWVLFIKLRPVARGATEQLYPFYLILPQELCLFAFYPQLVIFHFVQLTPKNANSYVFLLDSYDFQVLMRL